MQYEDSLLDISITRAKNNKAITWTKKSQKGAVALNQAQKCCKISNVRPLAHAKTRFAYILHYFKSLLINKDDIEYMYVKTYKPSDEYCEVVHVVFHTMKEVVAIIHKNELVGRRWLLSDALMEIVVIYLLCCDQSVVHEVDQRCAYIKENNENCASSVSFTNNLIELHYTISWRI